MKNRKNSGGKKVQNIETKFRTIAFLSAFNEILCFGTHEKKSSSLLSETLKFKYLYIKVWLTGLFNLSYLCWKRVWASSVEAER